MRVSLTSTSNGTILWVSIPLLFTCSVIATQCISGWLHRHLDGSGL